MAQPSSKSSSEKNGSPASMKNIRINMQECKQTMEISCCFCCCFSFYCFFFLFDVVRIVIVVRCLDGTLGAGFSQSITIIFA